MSRREYPIADRYEERESEFYRRPRRERDYDDLEVDITRERIPESRRAETIVRERDRESVVSGRRSERGPRQPEFLREDYDKRSSAGQLVIREERDDDVVSRAPTRRRSVETVRSRAPTERVVEKETVIIDDRERERDRALPYPRSHHSEIDFKEREAEEYIYRDRARSRAPTIREEPRAEEKIDITIRRDERSRSRPPAPRSEIRERDVEEIRFRRGGGDRPGPRVVEREEIDIRDRRSPAPPPPRSVVEKNEVDIDIDIRERRGRGRRASFKEEVEIRETSHSRPPRERSRSRLVARKEEEWVVRRPRTPPQRDYEKEEIIIRRKEKSPSPEPPREPTPEPPPPPVVEPIYRPPIIQEIITHHRHIDHGVERVRSPSPELLPSPPSPPREENLEIEIKRKGVRNGKAYEEALIIEKDTKESGGEVELDRREVSRQRSVSRSTRRVSVSPPRRRHYDDEISAEAEYYNRKISSRAYPGEAYNGATRDWGVVDVPPGTERVRMDGVGGGAQEIYWQRYNGERKGKFITNDRVYESDFGNSPPFIAPSAAPREREEREVKEEIKITETRTTDRERERERARPGRTRDKMWTEVTKDLVIREAIDEMGYSYEETDEHFYVIEYLRYEDVLRLVEITEEIKRERRERIREIQWEREESERLPKMLPAPPLVPAPPRSRYDERVYKRELHYDREGRRYR